MLWYALAPLAVLIVVLLALPYGALRESRRAAVRLDGTHSERRADAERVMRRRYFFLGAVLPVLLALALALVAALLTVPSPTTEEEVVLLELDSEEGAQRGRAAERARLEQMLAAGARLTDETGVVEGAGIGRETGIAGEAEPAGRTLPGAPQAGGFGTDAPGEATSGAATSGAATSGAGPRPVSPSGGVREAEALLGRPLTEAERVRLADLRRRYEAGENPADLVREEGFETTFVREAAGAAVRQWLGTTAQRFGVPAAVAVVTLLLTLFVVGRKRQFEKAFRERRRGYYATDNRRLEAAG
ncbi:MAG: hypothetical protein ACK41D_07980 [Rubricoccaceae bacterium]